MAKTVFSGFVIICRLAGCPTRTSPESVKATTYGVVRPPSAFSMTFALLPSISATHEYVVPRSMPIAFAMGRHSFRFAQCRPAETGAESECDVHRGGSG